MPFSSAASLWRGAGRNDVAVTLMERRYDKVLYASPESTPTVVLVNDLRRIGMVWYLRVWIHHGDDDGVYGLQGSEKLRRSNEAAL
jgi:hypothetical protein